MYTDIFIFIVHNSQKLETTDNPPNVAWINNRNKKCYIWWVIIQKKNGEGYWVMVLYVSFGNTVLRGRGKPLIKRSCSMILVRWSIIENRQIHRHGRKSATAQGCAGALAEGSWKWLLVGVRFGVMTETVKSCGWWLDSRWEDTKSRWTSHLRWELRLSH